jgi:universal stress protein A
MESYQRILAAIDIYSEYDQVLQTALGIVPAPQRLSLIFVTLPQNYFRPYIHESDLEYVHNIAQQARNRLSQIARKFDIPFYNVYLPVGEIAYRICDVAAHVKADLVVISSLTNVVVNYANQDVLVVRNDNINSFA